VPGPNTKPPFALIVDDETDICYLLSSILKQKNVYSVFASSLNEADKLLEMNYDFSIIFLDNHLPDGLGTSFIRRLKTKFPNTPVVMITAHDNSTDRLRAEGEGVDFFIGKPFSKEKIFWTLHTLMPAVPQIGEVITLPDHHAPQQAQA
jgi:two-component system OmpR family response regulator